MDHLSYYGFKEEPFSIMPLTNFYYHNEQHDQAKLRLKRSIDQMLGLAVLVGEMGTGKTLLARHLLESLPESEYDVSLLVVLHSDVTSQWLIRRIAMQFGIEDPHADKVQLISQLYKRLIDISEQNRRAVILIDEAHMLKQTETLEEIRGLLNLELPNSKLLSFVMFGMPELDYQLSKDAALKHRIAVRYELKNLSFDLLCDYISFRLTHAGSTDTIFSQHALEKIFELSKGNPRLVNVLCDNTLFEGYIRKSRQPLSADIVQSVGDDLALSSSTESTPATDRR